MNNQQTPGARLRWLKIRKDSALSLYCGITKNYGLADIPDKVSDMLTELMNNWSKYDVEYRELQAELGIVEERPKPVSNCTQIIIGFIPSEILKMELEKMEKERDGTGNRWSDN
jgi:hypothetical protein